jgi:hypothetical protein
MVDRTSAFRRLPGNKHRRFRVRDVQLLAEERDRCEQRKGVIRSALRVPADRT